MERHQHRVLLLATDDRDREGLTYLLALRGIAVVPARSSEAALDALRADAGFCLIVVDAPPAGAAALPILATDRTRRLPAVVARAPGSEAAEDDTARGCHLLAKPVDPDAVRALLVRDCPASHARSRASFA
ncbi:MAG TPA: hypothetical protein VFD84_05100 [Candidatus Binatia bacterium]|nr:hypothetical protein [Candidatus Binatia bacterium]